MNRSIVINDVIDKDKNISKTPRLISFIGKHHSPSKHNFGLDGRDCLGQYYYIAIVSLIVNKEFLFTSSYWLSQDLDNGVVNKLLTIIKGTRKQYLLLEWWGLKSIGN
uniref:Uncharacterized protein n=1 Tax=Cacopsylla melanoneura TaxID=428564 RepID=A0A8D9EAH3_9HEMI